MVSNRTGPLVTIYTQAYNTKPYLEQCINSVLTQTYQNFEYLLVDNGCTDGSSEIMKEFAKKDPRIRLFQYTQNQMGRPLRYEIAQEYAHGVYYTNLDSDDWLEPDYLERLLAFIEAYELDIACTGTMMHVMATGAQNPRKVERPLVLSRERFAEGLPWYHAFFRATWGKLIRTEYMKEYPPDETIPLPYGTDTLACFRFLGHANRIGVDHSILHHYRIHGSSVSYQYNPRRFDADVYLYNDAIDFLSTFGPVSPQNRSFLQQVYSNAVTDTTDVIRRASLSPAQKLAEYRAIATHPLTLAAYRECTAEDAVRSKNRLLQKALEAGSALGKSDDSDLRTVMRTLCLQCGATVSAQNAGMFLRDPPLLQALVQDNPQALLEHLLQRMKTNRDVKKYAIPETIQALAAGNPLLCQIHETAFLRKYGDIYQLVWRGETLGALDQMTGLLLEEQVTGGRETFLQLYISLSAALEQAPAFIFGKLQLAKLYLRQDRRAECQGIVVEFEEMGLSDHEDIIGLRHILEMTK